MSFDSVEVSYLPEEIAIGRVKKTLCYKAIPEKAGDLTEVAILELDPGAEILIHQHTVDMEYYINTADNTAKVCHSGEWHGYANTTRKPMTIISVKLAVIV